MERWMKEKAAKKCVVYVEPVQIKLLEGLVEWTEGPMK